MSYEVEKAKRIYANQGNKELLNFAHAHGKNLRPEIIPVLIAELRSRGLAHDLIAELETDSHILTSEESQKWITRIKSSTCPECQKQGEGLVCFNKRTAASLLIRCFYIKTFTICCRNCKRRILRESILSTSLFGWWSPFGLFRTPYSIIQNLLTMKKDGEVDKGFEDFVVDYLEELRTYEVDIVEILYAANRIHTNNGHSFGQYEERI